MAAKPSVDVPAERPQSSATSLLDKNAKRKPSVAASVAAQVRRKLEESKNVSDLDETRLKQTRIHFSKDFREIFVKFPGPDRELLSLDLSFLGAASRLAKPLAEGFRLYGVGKRVKTLVGRRSEIQIGFMAFLQDKDLLHIGLEAIDRSLWNQFKEWLDKKTDPRKGNVIQPKTRATTFGAIVVMLEALKSSAEFGELARAAFDARPSVTWDYVSTRTKPRERLSFDALKAIDSASAKDIEALHAKAESSERLLREGRERIAKENFDLFDLATCAAYIAQEYPKGLPPLSVLRKADPKVYASVDLSTSEAMRGHGVIAIKEILYPMARDLVPLVLNLAIETAMNPTTLFELTWQDIERGELLGEPVIRISGKKWRASEDPLVPVPAARIDPVLKLIARLTKSVRETVEEPLKDRIFLFMRIHGTNSSGRGFGGNDRGVTASDLSWLRGLTKFCADHELPAFTLSQIRTTIADEIAFREGIVVSSQVLGHQDVQITEKHYVSDGTRWREAERLGNAMLFMERWFDTEGNIDPRRNRLTPRMDRGAATPGFQCFDPYDSPWPMQRKNRLCTAYGLCPSCPLAAADVKDSGAVALYLSLRTAIFDGQGQISGEAWLARYGQVLIDLNALLKHVPTDVMESAIRFQVNLPPVE